MRLPAFEFHTPGSVHEVLGLVEEYSGTVELMAGGTDLLPSLRSGKRRCQHVVALKGVTGLAGLDFDEAEGLRIGAGAALVDVMEFTAVRERYPALASAIRTLATVQVRHKGTVVGNLCNASPCADTAPPLLALGARLSLVGPGGRREVALEEFITGPGRTARAAEELIECVRVPTPPEDLRATFLKFSPRSKVDISTVSVAAVLRLEDGRIRDARLCLGTVAPTPLRSRGAETLLEGAAPDRGTLAAAAAAAREECSPISDFRASAAFKAHLIEVLSQRALNALVEGVA